MVNIDTKLEELKKYFKNNNNIIASWFIGS